MLTTANSGYGIRTLRFWSHVGFISLKLDKNGVLRVSRDLTQILLHRIWTCLTGFYTAYLLLGLYQLMQKDQSEWILTLFSHLNHAYIATAALYWNHEFAFRSPELLATVFNDCSESFGTFSGRKALRQILAMFPILWAFYPTSMLLLYIQNPLASYTTYSGLPEAYQTLTFSVACALTEYALSMFILAQIYMGVFTILIFFQLIQREQEDGLQEISLFPYDGSQEPALEYHINRCRLLQLRILLFNKLFAHLVYYMKILCLEAGVFGIFFAIRIYESNLTLAIVSGYVGLADIVVFNVLFHRAGDLPENIRHYKREIRRLGKRDMAGSENSEEFRKFLERSLKSVRETGISLGGFYCFESVSTMEFCDFVFNQAIGLLLTYREPIVVGPRHTGN